MQDIIYDIHSKSPLIIGYAGETNARNAVFKGYNKVKDNSSIVINIKGIGSRPLVNFCLPVKYTYTKDEGTYEAYLCELITENGVITYERHSNNFEMLVKHSAPLETEATPSEEQFDDWSAEITGAIADLNGRAASGEFDGEDGFSPTVNITKTGRTTTITITDKSGTHTATVTDGADGGAYDDTSIKNRLNAIEGKEEEWNAKAETTDIPTKVSELQNDKGYLTEHQDISGLVEKVDGKGLSTNDYDNNAKNKVDAIPANAKYTDTVYDDTAVKGRLNAIEDMADGSVTKQLNDDLANKLDKPSNTVSVGKVLKVKTVNADGTFVCEWADDNNSDAVSDVKVNGTSVVSDGVATVPLTVYSTMDNYGLVRYKESNGIYPNGQGYLTVARALDSQIAGRTEYYRPIVPANLKYAVDSVLCSDSASEALTSSQQNKALARLNAEKAKGEWVLKGTITDGSGCIVDLSGCTELLIDGNTVGTAATNLNTIVGGSQKTLLSISVNGTRYYYLRFDYNGKDIEPVVARYGNDDNLSGNISAFVIKGKKVSEITTFKFGNSASITSVDLKIYAR